MVSRTSGLLLGLLPLTAAFAPASLLPGLRAASGASSLQACRTPLRAQAPRAAFSRSAALRMQDGEKKEEMVLITGNWQKKSPTEVSSMLAADPDLMYIDVRTEDEYAKGHVADAWNVAAFSISDEGLSPLTGTFMMLVKMHMKDKAAPIVVACASGKRSTAACKWLEDDGFTNLIEMQTGFGGWVQDGLPVEK